MNCPHRTAFVSWLGCEKCEKEQRDAKRWEDIRRLMGWSFPPPPAKGVTDLPVRHDLHTCPACMGKGVVRVVEGD